MTPAGFTTLGGCRRWLTDRTISTKAVRPARQATRTLIKARAVRARGGVEARVAAVAREAPAAPEDRAAWAARAAPAGRECAGRNRGAARSRAPRAEPTAAISRM